MAFFCLQGFIHYILPPWHSSQWSCWGRLRAQPLFLFVSTVSWSWFSNCLSSPDFSVRAFNHHSTALCPSLPWNTHTPTHTDCCCVTAVLCVCSGGRAPPEPSHSFLTIYVTAAARAPGSLFTLLTSLRSLLWLHLSSSLGKSHAEGISSSTLSYLVLDCWLLLSEMDCKAGTASKTSLCLLWLLQLPVVCMEGAYLSKNSRKPNTNQKWRMFAFEVSHSSALQPTHLRRRKF